MKLRTVSISAVAAVLAGIAQTYLLLATWDYINAYSSLASALLTLGLRGTPLYAVSFVLGFLLTTVLSLPAAFLLTKLRPAKLTIYLLCAVMPSFIWINRSLLDNSFWLTYFGTFALGWVTELLALPFATWLLRKTKKPSAPNNSFKATVMSLDDNPAPGAAP